MAKICDHTSVGMLVKNSSGELLLIERAKFPFGFAPPAGHVDGDSSFENAALRELSEEVGLDAKQLIEVFSGRVENKCRREGGDWHEWKIYEVDVVGELKRSEDETKRAGWYSLNEIKRMGERTKEYLAKKVTDEEWEKQPGLETFWYVWFNQQKML